jgi:hypothetical protein
MIQPSCDDNLLEKGEFGIECLSSRYLQNGLSAETPAKRSNAKFPDLVRFQKKWWRSRVFMRLHQNEMSMGGKGL